VVQMKLVVDGQDIEANDFVRDIIVNTVAGATVSLRGVNEDWKELELKIVR